MPGVLSSDDLPSVPTPLSPLVGRVRECAALTELLPRGSVRLLTLTGRGGVGKTRLALQVAADLADHFADGVAFVSLAALTDAEQVPIAIAQVCGLREGGGALTERPRAYLRDRRRLLLLDNFEQVVEAAPLLVDLLVACPGVKLLVTSRTSLRVTGEQEFHVQPLTLPDAMPPITAERAIQSAAVTLFVQRMQSAQPDFVVTPDNAPTLTEICHRLDGIPLAIELAAARVRVLSPPALLGRLGRRLPLLTGGARDAPVRLQTMRGAIAWSYDLLDADEQALFRRLAVFAGSFSLDAAEAVARGRESGVRGQGKHGASSPTPDSLLLPPDVFDGLASLVDKSLVRQAAPANGEPRYRILETIREHGLERLEAASEESAVRDAHAAVYLALAEEAETHLAQAVEPSWLDRLDAEHDNLRAALAWLAARGDAGRLLRLGGALWLYWYYHGHLSEGRRWIEAGLAIPAAATDPARAWRCCGWLRPG